MLIRSQAHNEGVKVGHTITHLNGDALIPENTVKNTEAKRILTAGGDHMVTFARTSTLIYNMIRTKSFETTRNAIPGISFFFLMI